MEVEVIDNFLSPEEFDKIQSTIENPYFPWYYNDGINYSGDGKYQFTHTFYDLKKGGELSSYLTIFDNFLLKLNVFEILRIKVNLNPKTFFKQNTGFHIDFKDVKTAVFYINDNNGGTKFKKGNFVKSVSNRIVIFESNSEHAGITCTDKNMRIVVNFNYK